MGDVHLAIVDGSRFARLFALKVLRVDAENDSEELVQMFENEARLAALLNHPNIVQATDIGEDEDGHFIAMEYLEGQPLSRVRQRCRETGTPLPLEEQIYILCQVLEALDYAHNLKDHRGNELHLVHRDVSPQNIFLTYAGATKLVDFGIAKTLGTTRTRIGVIKGKVPYMSPEQALNRPLDHRSDLFSVGIILWEAIAGRRMWAGVDSNDVQRRVAAGNLPSLRAAKPDVSPKLEALVARALAPELDDRYPDADTFRNELVAALEGRLVDTRKIGARIAVLFEEERRQIDEIVRNALSVESTPGFEDAASTDEPSRIEELTLSAEQHPPPPDLELSKPSPALPEPKPEGEEDEPPGTRRVGVASARAEIAHANPPAAQVKAHLPKRILTGLGGLVALTGVVLLVVALVPERMEELSPPVLDISSASHSKVVPSSSARVSILPELPNTATAVLESGQGHGNSPPPRDVPAVPPTSVPTARRPPLGRSATPSPPPPSSSSPRTPAPAIQVWRRKAETPHANQ